jgi:hypothetical protein
MQIRAWEDNMTVEEINAEAERFGLCIRKTLLTTRTPRSLVTRLLIALQELLLKLLAFKDLCKTDLT